MIKSLIATGLLFWLIWLMTVFLVPIILKPFIALYGLFVLFFDKGE